MHRFFLTDISIQVNQTIDLMPLAHQLRNVLRLQSDTLITLLDNQGNEFDVRITALGSKRAVGDVLTQRQTAAELPIPLTLYQCSLKADKFEWVLQKGTELGVHRFVPVISQRSIVRPATALLKKYGRWRTILREAAEQCGRGQIPKLLAPCNWQEATADTDGLSLLPWEAETTTAPHLGSGTMQLFVRTADSLSLLIGPEGGIATDEAQSAQAAGWQTVSLGPRILRAETAALASIALISSTIESVPR